MPYTGIDVSKHNGKIDWKTASKSIDFAIIRAGYGKNNIDERLNDSIEGCKSYHIPFGLYWFSYALTEADAKKEADYICDIADKHKPVYPIAFDWEYDSDKYYKKQKGSSASNAIRRAIALSFLTRIKERGYTPMIYTNADYIAKGFSDLVTKYDLWLANWGVNSPYRSCDIWQKTDVGKIAGVNGNVDVNICYKNYGKNNVNDNAETKEEKLKKLENIFWSMYMDIAKDTINGKYGNGADRKRKLKSLGYDYDIVQNIVNILIQK